MTILYVTNLPFGQFVPLAGVAGLFRVQCRVRQGQACPADPVVYPAVLGPGDSNALATVTAHFEAFTLAEETG